MISQSVAWWCYVPDKLNPEEFVRAVAETGYAAIDLVPPTYFELVAAHGLPESSRITPAKTETAQKTARHPPKPQR